MEAVKLGLILKKRTLISVLLKGWFLLCLPKRCAQSFLTYIEIMPSPTFMTGVDKRKKGLRNSCNAGSLCFRCLVTCAITIKSNSVLFYSNSNVLLCMYIYKNTLNPEENVLERRYITKTCLF